MGKIEAIMREKLIRDFDPQTLNIDNESHKHAGHAGSPQTGQSHFFIYMTSQSFEGQNRITRQRRVYQTLQVELADPIHALVLTLKTPSEEQGEK